MKGIRRHLTYANVISTLTLFLVLGGGTALAAYVVSSNGQVGPDTISGHKPRTGDHANIIGGTVNGTDIATGGVVGRNVSDGSLTGADIADRSGVDTCPPTLTVKLGPICAGGDGVARDWLGALHYCSRLGLRLPTIAEGVTLAENYDVPGVDASQEFWMEETDGTEAPIDDENGDALGFVPEGQPNIYTVCVTDPSA
jgi:hypothetical protein